MLGTGSPLPATTPRLAISFSKLPCRPSPPGYCRSTTNVRIPRRSTVWSTPGLVETRFSPDALVWVAVVFHGTAAWRNHGLIILPLLFIEHLSSCAVQLPRQVAGLRPPGPRPLGLGISSSGTPACAAGSPGWARVTRSVIARDAGGALDLGGGSVAPVPRPARRCPPAAAPA